MIPLCVTACFDENLQDSFVHDFVSAFASSLFHFAVPALLDFTFRKLSRMSQTAKVPSRYVQRRKKDAVTVTVSLALPHSILPFFSAIVECKWRRRPL
jgi:hypothetical protein